MSNRTVFMAALAVGIMIGAPFAVAGTRDPLREGIRNPTSGDATRETQVIARTARDTYGTRQSNLGAGGGAIYGCRSVLDTSSVAAVGDPKRSTPCLRVNNLRTGKAFDFQSNTGRLIGVIQSGNNIASPRPTVAPFVTNATGVAVGLNADRVDNLSASEIIAQAVQAAKTAGGGGGGASAGCPANTILVGGGCIENAPRPAATYAAASAACGGAGRRLVPPDVLLHARTVDGVDLGGGEMSADITAASVLVAVITQGYATVSDAGAVATNALTAAAPFRCITG